MAANKLSTLTVGGTKYGLRGSLYHVLGTQTSNTASWTGKLPEVNELYTGLTIAYFLPRTSASNVTLNLTLGTATSGSGAVNCYFVGSTRLGTQYAAGSTIIMTYYKAGDISIGGTATTDNRWVVHNYTNSNTTYTAASSVSAIATAAVTGTSTAYARQDHVHNITGATITSALGFTPLAQTDIEGLSGAMHYIGTTTASITDGNTSKPSDVTGTGASGALASGDVVISGEKEFVWNGSKWQEFGSTGSLKALAFKDNATASYQPAGTLTITLPTASKNVVSSVSTASKNVVSSVSTGSINSTTGTTTATTVVTGVTTAAQTIATGGSTTTVKTVNTAATQVVTGVTTAAQTVITGSSVANEILSFTTASIGKTTAVSTASLVSVTPYTTINTASINKVTAVNTGSVNSTTVATTATTVVTNVTTAAQTMVTGVTTAAQTMVTGQPSTKTFTGTTATITVS